jgi:hypothetical protein
MYINIHMHIHISTYLHHSLHLRWLEYALLEPPIHVCIYIYIYICIYIFMYMCINAYLYIHLNIYLEHVHLEPPIHVFHKYVYIFIY